MKLLLILCLVASFIPKSQPFPYSVELDVGQASWVSPQQWINYYYYEMEHYELFGFDITNCTNGDSIILVRSSYFEQHYRYPLVMRISNQGEVHWSFLYHSTMPCALIHRTDDQFFLIGEFYEGGEKWLDITCIEGLTGDLLWSRNHSLSFDIDVRDATATNDAGVLVACNMDDSRFQNRTWFGLRFDSNGNLLWNQTYAEHTPRGLCTITNCQDGSFLLVGQETSEQYMGYRFVAYRLESDGSVRWTQIYEDSFPYDVVESPSGGFLILGETGIRIDDEGNQLWNNSYWPSGDGGSIVACDQGFLITGISDLPNERDTVYATRIDNDGNIFWQWSQAISLYGVYNCAAMRSEEGGFYIVCSAYVVRHPAMLLVRLPETPVPTQMIQQISFNCYLWATVFLLLISIGLYLLLQNRGTTREPFRRIYEQILAGNIQLYLVLNIFWLLLWLTGPVSPLIGYMLNYPPDYHEFGYQFQNALITPSGIFFFLIGIGVAIIFQGLEFIRGEKPNLQQNAFINVTRTMGIYIILAISLCLFGIWLIYLPLQNPWTWNIYLQQSFYVFPIILLGQLTGTWFPKYLFFRNYERQLISRD